MEEAKMNLAQKLGAIRKMAAAVKKSASGYNYTYAPEDEVLAAITAGMNKYGVDLHIEVKDGWTLQQLESEKIKTLKNGESRVEKNVEWLFTGNIKFKWINMDDTTDTREGNWPIIGQQSDSSQAFGSAATYCTRYFYLKYFQIATTKDDPDNYRSKQKQNEDRENTLLAKAIVDEMHANIVAFMEGHADQKEELSKIIKKHVKVGGKPSGDYFKVTDPDVAFALQTEIDAFIESVNNNPNKKTK